MIVQFLHPKATKDHVGLIPSFLDEADPRPAAEQFNERYAFGGGWQPMEGFVREPRTNKLKYPGYPPLFPLALIPFRDEVILIYQFAWVMIIQPDNSWVVARMD
jgi:hypothetical protein